MSAASTGKVCVDKWTVETVREHLAEIIRANDARYAQQFDSVTLALASLKESIGIALTAADRAVSKAENATERRFEGVNEFRKTLDDAQRTLMPRIESDVRFTALTERVDIIAKLLNEQRGQRAGMSQGWGLAVAAVGLILTVVTIVAAAIAIGAKTP